MYNYNKYNRALGFNERKLNSSDFIVSKTDKKGIITYANPSLLKITEYTMDELIGENHNIIRHPDMPRALYKHVWDEIQEGRHVYAYIKNLTKDGSFYWVFAYIVPDYNDKGDVIGYHSERRAPNLKALPDIVNLYNNMKQIEVNSGVDDALAYMNELVSSKADSYTKYVFKLQNQE
jgi:PAS domain S-box-containing protein